MSEILKCTSNLNCTEMFHRFSLYSEFRLVCIKEGLNHKSFFAGSTYKGVISTHERRHTSTTTKNESAAVTLTWHASKYKGHNASKYKIHNASKYKVHKLHQRLCGFFDFF